ncbi:hypothetical protein ACIOEZ_13555 [Streptomyces sp. NPDC087866]|uniref:hypothetical protein n=1 Tax=unclassified Streptomyces TaxID=2593676 RepID=UPI0033B3421D
MLQATVARVDEENGALRGRVVRFESLLRAFSWTVGWADAPGGIEPKPVHPLVDEYNRDGA